MMEHNRPYPPYDPEARLNSGETMTEEQWISYYVYQDLANLSAGLEEAAMALPSDDDLQRVHEVIDTLYEEGGGVIGDRTHVHASMTTAIMCGAIESMRAARQVFIQHELEDMLDGEAGSGTEEAG